MAVWLKLCGGNDAKQANALFSLKIEKKKKKNKKSFKDSKIDGMFLSCHVRIS